MRGTLTFIYTKVLVCSLAVESSLLEIEVSTPLSKADTTVAATGSQCTSFTLRSPLLVDF